MSNVTRTRKLPYDRLPNHHPVLETGHAILFCNNQIYTHSPAHILEAKSIYLSIVNGNAAILSVEMQTLTDIYCTDRPSPAE